MNYSYFNSSQSCFPSFRNLRIELLKIPDISNGMKKKKKTLSFQNSGITDSPDEKLEQVGAFYTYRRTRATRSINRRVASRRPTATNMVLHLFLAKVERKLDYSRAKLPSDVGRREKRPTMEVPLLADSQSTTLPLSFPHYFLLLFCHSLVASL